MIFNSDLRRLFRFMFVDKRAVTLSAIGLMAVGGIAEGISVMALFPLIAVFFTEQASGSAVLQSTVEVAGIPLSPLPLLLLVVGGVFVKALFYYISQKKTGRIVAQAVTETRLGLISRLFAVDQTMLSEAEAGRFQNDIGIDAVLAAESYDTACEFFSRLIQTLIYVAIIYIVSPSLAIVSITLGCLIFVLSRSFFRDAHSSGRNRLLKMRSFTTKLLDSIRSLKVIKSMAKEQLFLEQLRTDAKGVQRAMNRHSDSVAWLTSIQEPMLVLGILAGLFVAFQFNFTDPSKIAVLGFIFFRVSVQLRLGMAAYQMCMNKVSAFVSVEDTLQLLAVHEDTTGGSRYIESPVELEFRDVDFSYGDTPVLERASFGLPKNSMTVIVGASGTGKSTILELCTGLVKADRGAVLVNGIPIDQLDQAAYRSLIGFSPQSPALFYGTIRDNICLGDKRISDADLEYAISTACASQFIQRFPGGMEFNVGDHGKRLSSGQSQRIGLARALVTKPGLLLLDEATGTLDSGTSGAVTKSLQTLKKSSTILAASHQQDLVHIADYHLVVHGHRVESITREQALAITATQSDRPLIHGEQFSQSSEEQSTARKYLQ